MHPQRFLVVLLPLLVAACGEQESPASDAACPNAAPTAAGEFDRFELAVARAVDRAVPLLILIRPPHIHCPPADRLETLLRTTPDLEARCSFVVVDGGAAAGEDEQRLVARARAGAAFPPMLVIATAQAEILHVQLSGLMPYYAQTGEPLAQDPGPMLTGQQVLALLERVRESLETTDKRLAELAAPTSPVTELERAELLLHRGRWEQAGSAAAGVVPRDLSMEDARRLFDLLLSTGQGPLARSFAQDLLAHRPQAKSAGWLELGLLWSSPEEGPEGQGLARLGRLIEAARSSGCLDLEVSLRAVRVSMLSRATPASTALLDQDLGVVRAANRELFKNRSQEGPRVLSTLAYAAELRRDYLEAERLVLQLNEEYPDSGEAIHFRHGRLDRIRKQRGGHVRQPLWYRQPGEPAQPPR